MLELRGVSKSYGKVLALRNVDLTVRAGELVSIVGPSGSGKSTLLQIAGTLDRPSSGTVRVAGYEISELSDGECRGEIGLRRSFGATRGQVRTQFLVEALLLSTLGGGAGVLLGALATFVYARANSLPAVLPPWAPAGALATTVLIGTLAGIYPALRAARVPPTVALSAQ